MTQSIAPKKMCQRTIMLSEKIVRKLENRAIAHGNTLGEEIAQNMISLWAITSDFDNPADELDFTQQQVLRTITRIHDRINPTAADLRNYLKNIDLPTISATLQQLVELEYITAMRTSHSTRYTLK